MKSRWRQHARRVIATVLAERTDLEGDALWKAVSAAYPFGERAHHPYKIWLDEVAKHRADREHLLPAPSPEDAGVLLVAADLVELGRIDEARAVLAEQAPNATNRLCRVCGAKPKKPCVDWSGEVQIVPHHARVEAPAPGPLFGGVT